MNPPRSKVDLIHFLADTRGYRTYLELCTPTTGGFYAAIDRSRFSVRHRLMYRCPDDFDDGQPIDCRSPTVDIAPCLSALRGRRYDIALIDPWHEYQASRRDIDAGLQLLVPGGTMLVHDCLPPNERVASPTHVEGEWCGVTYQAYLDVVTTRRHVDYCTVDTDYGCGIVRKLKDESRARRWLRERLPRVSDRIDSAPATPLAAQWRTISQNGGSPFAFFQDHKTALLKLRSVDEFAADNSGQASRAPSPEA